MTIKTIVIEGIDQDISIRRTERGAEVTIEQNTRRSGRQDICIAPSDNKPISPTNKSGNWLCNAVVNTAPANAVT